MLTSAGFHRSPSHTTRLTRGRSTAERRRPDWEMPSPHPQLLSRRRTGGLIQGILPLKERVSRPGEDATFPRAEKTSAERCQEGRLLLTLAKIIGLERGAFFWLGLALIEDLQFVDIHLYTSRLAV